MHVKIHTYTHAHTHSHVNAALHTFKWVNYSRWVTACVLTPAPYVHWQHHYQGNWSHHCTNTLQGQCVKHTATTSGIILPQHKERAMMHDGLCAAVAYRPRFIICFPWRLRDMLLYSARWGKLWVWVTEHWSKEEFIWSYEVSDSQGVNGGKSGGLKN